MKPHRSSSTSNRKDLQDDLRDPDTYSQAYIKNIMETFCTATSNRWANFKKTLNPRLTRICLQAFRDGKVGHRFRPLTGKEERLLLWAMDLHPGALFDEEEGRVVGAMICGCQSCHVRTSVFVLETGIELHAQQKGDLSYVREDDNATLSALKNARWVNTKCASNFRPRNWLARWHWR